MIFCCNHFKSNVNNFTFTGIQKNIISTTPQILDSTLYCSTIQSKIELIFVNNFISLTNIYFVICRVLIISNIESLTERYDNVLDRRQQNQLIIEK